MDWQATGTIDSEQLRLDEGRDRWGPIGSALIFDPAIADLDAGAAAQVDFACNAIGEAILGGLIEGVYAVTIHGHWPADESERKSVTLELVAA